MREYKFRAWIPQNDGFNKKGMYGIFSFRDIENGEDEANVWCSNTKQIQEPKWDKIILMQYSGFKDSDGKDLYDEDIVKWGDGFYILRWSKIYNWYEFVGNITADTPHADENGVFKDNVKLVGNTYENPELIPELLGRPQND